MTNQGLQMPKIIAEATLARDFMAPQITQNRDAPAKIGVISQEPAEIAGT